MTVENRDRARHSTTGLRVGTSSAASAPQLGGTTLPYARPPPYPHKAAGVRRRTADESAWRYDGGGEGADPHVGETLTETHYLLGKRRGGGCASADDGIGIGIGIGHAKGA